MLKNSFRAALVGMLAAVMLVVGGVSAFAVSKTGFKNCQANYHVTIRSDASGMIYHLVHSQVIDSFWRPKYSIDVSHSWFNTGPWEVSTNGGINSPGTYAGCAFGI